MITRFAPPTHAAHLEPAGEAIAAAFMHMEGACGESWPLGSLQIAFVPPGVLPPGGLYCAAGLIITSADHLFVPRCIEQVRGLNASALVVVVLKRASAGEAAES